MLTSMADLLEKGLIGPGVAPDTKKRVQVEGTIRWKSSPPQMDSDAKMNVGLHIGLLSTSSERIADTYAAEAHMYHVVVYAPNPLSFIRASVLWCMYSTALGYKSEALEVVLILHLMGMAHRLGDVECEARQRERVQATILAARRDMYERINRSR